MTGEMFGDEPEMEEENDDAENEGAGKKADAGRDSRGRFVKGQSGNPGGRMAIPGAVRRYAREAPEKMYAIAMDESTPVKVRADIWKWFAEMIYGRPRQQVDMEASVTAPPVAVRFEGVLDQWSK